MTTRVLSLALVLALASCGGADEIPVSETTDPLVDFGIEPPDVVTGWPCPPFEGVVTTQDMVGDTDGDTLTDCQEEQLGSDWNADDSDGDGVIDFLELGGDPLDPLDTDGDTLLDLVDDDDDGDLVPTEDEDTNDNGDFRDDDNDADGRLDYVDGDDDNDLLAGAVEDWDADGDPRNDDSDLDGTADYLDADDDNDTVLTRNEDPDGNRSPASDDSDSDGLIDCHDPDDDGDGILTEDEDANGDASPSSDDLDGDGIPDFRDLDEDGDAVSTLDEDRNGSGVLDDDLDADGTPDFRDNDDDNDLVTDEDIDGKKGEGDGDALNDDTDGDTIPNVLDSDDDGDGCPSNGEDLDGDLDPTNDGVGKTDTLPNYLDPAATTCTVAVVTPYDLTVTGTGLPAPAEGDAVIVALFEDGGAQVGTNQAGTITGGAFSVVFPNAIVTGSTYHVDLFVDGDGNGSCVALEQTFAYRIDAISTTGQDETVQLDRANDGDVTACATFP